MIANADMTLYHAQYDKNTGCNTYIRNYFPRCSWVEDEKINLGGGALDAADMVKVRIPTADEIPIKNGDFFVKGKSESAAPPQGAYTVVRFSDNRYGIRSTRHWRVWGQ